MIRLTSLEVYNSMFNVTQDNNKLELYTDTFDEFSFEELKDELEQILSFSHVTPPHRQHEIHAIIGPRKIEAYELRLQNSSTDDYVFLIMGHARSPFRDFESYLRFVVGLNECDIQLILKNLLQILSLMKYLQGLTHLNIFQRLFTPWEIMEEPYKLKKMKSAWEQSLL